MTLADVLSLTPAGLYCPAGGFHIDPMRAVDRALITHGHSDHARRGHVSVLATRETLDFMAIRYGANFAKSRDIAAYGRTRRIGEVDVTFHPAGHVLGSAQILIEARGFRVVVSGDYKRAADPTCAAFEPVLCDAFITEATFGLPVFRGMNADAEIAKLTASLRTFPDRAHLVGAYSLGKAQRVMALLRAAGWERPVHLHRALTDITQYYAEAGAPIGAFQTVGEDAADLAGEVVLCPPQSIREAWAARFNDPVTAFASGWNRVRALAKRGGHVPLAISDHADWDDLRSAIIDTGCSELWVTHGAEDGLIHWARGRGISARPLGMVGYNEGADA